MPNSRSRRAAAVDGPPCDSSEAARALRGVLTELNAGATAAERAALSSNTLGSEPELGAAVLRFVSLDAAMAYYRLCHPGDGSKYVRMLARMIEVDPGRVAEANSGEALLLAVRTTRRIVVDRQDALGNGETELPSRQHLVRSSATPAF